MKESQEKNPANLLLIEIVARMRVWLDRAEACIDQLDEAHMWYRPNASSNAIGNLVLHLVGNLRQWILGGIGNQPDTRDRPAEFAAKTGHSKGQLISLLHDAVEQSCDVIGKLATNRIMERKLIQGEDVTNAYALVMAVSHLGLHVGVRCVTHRHPRERRGARPLQPAHRPGGATARHSPRLARDREARIHAAIWRPVRRLPLAS